MSNQTQHCETSQSAVRVGALQRGATTHATYWAPGAFWEGARPRAPQHPPCMSAYPRSARTRTLPVTCAEDQDQSAGFTYNDANQLTVMSLYGLTMDFTYDAWGRLATRAQGGYAASTPPRVSFSFRCTSATTRLYLTSF
jgi:YD repeat-containing protein